MISLQIFEGMLLNCNQKSDLEVQCFDPLAVWFPICGVLLSPNCEKNLFYRVLTLYILRNTEVEIIPLREKKFSLFTRMTYKGFS